MALLTLSQQMEKFKAVEKAMKTKAYSKEGLASSAKLDPQEQAKAEASDFLSSMVDELEQQIETLEAESESIQATMKKGKNQSAKAERIAEIERIIERHKWHQSKLELIRRSLENGGVDTDQVTDLEELIRYYVSDGMNDDYIEDDEMYDDLNLDEEEGVYGMPQDGDKGSSQDAQSQAEEPTPEPEIIKPPSAKPKAVAEVSASGRRSSAQSKSPLPALATLHTPLATISNGNSSGPVMKPASVPARPAEGLKYASAAAAAAASDKIGISPLPPPPGAQPVAIASPAQAKTSVSNSPATTSAHPVAAKEPEIKQPTVPSASTSETLATSAKAMPTPSKAEKRAAKNQAAAEAAEAAKGKLPRNCSRLHMLTIYSCSNERRRQRRQACRGGRRRGVDIPPSRFSPRPRRVVRDVTQPPAFLHLSDHTAHAPGIAGHVPRHYGHGCTADLPPRRAHFVVRNRLPFGASSAIRGPASVPAHRS